MLAELTTALSSLNGAMTLLKGLNAESNQAKINEVKIGLQAQIFEAQTSLAASLERIRELEQEITTLKAWDSEKTRYKLDAIDVHAFAYVLKPGMEDGEPPHWLCTECFTSGHKSILQYSVTHQGVGQVGIQAIWRCGSCKSEVSVFHQRSPDRPYAPGRRQPPEAPAPMKVEYDPFGPEALPRG